MNDTALTSLAQLIRSQRVLSLGSLREGSPQVTLAAYANAPQFGSFLLLLSGLARHTRAIEEDPSVGFLISEADTGKGDPLRLARVSMQGRIARVSAADPELDTVRGLYLARFPDAARLLELADFAFYRIEPTAGRFVAGFGQAFNIGQRDLADAASQA